MAKYVQPNFIVDSSASFLKNTTFNGLTAFDSSIRFGGVTYSSFGTMAVESSANYYTKTETNNLVVSGTRVWNGLTKSVDGSIGLGGSLLQDTVIDGSSFILNLGSSWSNSIAGLNVNTNGSGINLNERDGGGIHVNSYGSGGINLFDHGGGGIYIDDVDGGGLYINDKAAGGTFFRDKQGGGVSFISGTASGEAAGGFVIEQGSNVHKILGGGITFTNYDGSNGYSLIDLSEKTVSIFETYSGSLDFSQGKMTITDNSSNHQGLQYAADYSSTFVNRSLVDKGYVDGKIGSSDSSIAALILKDTQIDASIVRIDLTNAAQDASITALKLKDTQIDASIARIDASLNDVVDITTILDASFNELYATNTAQDASITALKLKDTQIDASISRIDASIASLLSGTVESWNGLTKTDNSIGLGGKLIQDTIIHGDNSLSLVLGANYTSDVSQLYNFTVGASTIDFYAKSFKLMPQEGGFPDFSLDPDEIRLGSSSGANKGRLTLCRTDGQLTTYGSSGAPILMSSPTQLTTYGSSGAPILMSSPTNLSYLFDGVTSFTYSSTQGLYIPSPNKIDLRTSGSGAMIFSANGSGGINFFNSDSSSSGVTSFYGKNIPSSSFNLYQFKKFNYVSSLNGLTIDNSIFRLYNNYFSFIQDTSGKFITATFKEANPNGLVYAADYSANYINRSLVDKAYVDSKAASSSIAWNGLTKTVDGSIGLGGILAQDSNIITNDKILSVTGNLTVTGNLVVDGSITSVNSVNLNVSDNIITVNAGQTGSGVSRGYAGLLVDRGTADPYVFVFEESSDTFRIGIGTEGGLPTGTQAVATRQDVPIAAGIAYWNNSQNRFDTVSGFTYDASGLGLGTVVASTTESTALFFDGEHVVSRELGTNAFSSTVFATDASITALTNRLNTTDASVALLQTKDTQIDASIVRIDASIASLVTKGASVYKGTFDGTAGTTTTITAATHELGVGPLSISVYDGVEQVYTDVECAANGDMTLTWGSGTLTASCKYVIIG